MLQEIHNARDGAILLPCSHYLHHSCYVGLLENGLVEHVLSLFGIVTIVDDVIVTKYRLYKCPLCNTSMIDMKKHWQRMDEERKEWSMPRRYRNFLVQVRNDVFLICHYVYLFMCRCYVKTAMR